MSFHVLRGGDRNNDTSITAATSSSTGISCPEIIQDTEVYRGWRTITQRKVRMKTGKIVDYDVSRTVDTAFCFLADQISMESAILSQ